MTRRYCELFVGIALLLAAPRVSAILNNDNTRPAGRLDADVLIVRMVADTGSWQPEGRGGAALRVAAFGEEGRELSVPGPLIRVREGATIAVTLRNALSADLHVAGLCSRPGNCDAVVVPAGSSRDFRFRLNAPGTYYYWASTQALTLPKRSRFDSQLGGAIVVDARDATAVDRVFVISIYDDPLPISSDPRLPPIARSSGAPQVFAINGASWPHTERLVYQTGEAVRWRVVNLSNIGHAMHLHGFHFVLDSMGDGTTDRPLAPEQRRTEVTEFVAPGRTFAISWMPTRPGNWLYHCHMVEHMSAVGLDLHGHAGDDHAGMAGLVLGIRVTGSPLTEVASSTASRHLRIVLREDPNRYGPHPGFRIDAEGTDAPRLDAGPVPGPVLVLQRAEPVEIEVVNRLSEPTAMHWHGIELESYFDGVPGYAGQGDHIAPAIAPGTSFVAKFTPPRAGTFIYHTHWHDNAQLAGGLYGALLVLEPGEKYDASVDHVVIIGLNGVLVDGQREPFALNGRASPAPIPMRVGVPNRLRLINITANNDGLTAFLLDQFEPTTWRPLAKDGAALPPDLTKPRLARQLVSVGETHDFEVVPTSAQRLWLEIRRINGELVLQAPVVVR